MIETMTAYENYEFNMDLIEDLFRHIAVSVFGRTEFTVAGHDIDFGRPWRRVRMSDAVKEATGLDLLACGSTEEANALLAGIGLTEPQPSVGHALAYAFEEKAGPLLVEPTLVYGHPVEISPLAKPQSEDPRLAERFEIFIAGMDAATTGVEQNDPVNPAGTLEAVRASRTWTRGASPAGLRLRGSAGARHPPTTGIGPGIERMAMIFLELQNIDDGHLLPDDEAGRLAGEPRHLRHRGATQPAGEAPCRHPEPRGVREPCRRRRAEAVHEDCARTPALCRLWLQGAPRKAWHATGSYEIGGLQDHNPWSSPARPSPQQARASSKSSYRRLERAGDDLS